MGDSSGYKHYVAGLAAGVATVITGHPFDTVKVKLQKHNTEGNGIKYKNGWHCTVRILKTEGVCLLTSCERTLPRRNTFFCGNGLRKLTCFWHLLSNKASTSGRNSTWEARAQGYNSFGSFWWINYQLYIVSIRASEGNCNMESAYHFDEFYIMLLTLCVQCRMQIQGADSVVPNSNRYAGPLDCAIKTVKAEGVTGIFRGGVTTFFRESIGNAVFFSTYEYVRYYMHLQMKSASPDPSNLMDVGVGIVSGGLGGIAFWSAVLPLDVAKTIIQTSPDKSSTRNPFQILKSIYRRSGFRGCYTGLGPTVARAFPANATAIVTFELAVKVLGIRRD